MCQSGVLGRAREGFCGGPYFLTSDVRCRAYLHFVASDLAPVLHCGSKAGHDTARHDVEQKLDFGPKRHAFFFWLETFFLRRCASKEDKAHEEQENDDLAAAVAGQSQSLEASCAEASLAHREPCMHGGRVPGGRL